MKKSIKEALEDASLVMEEITNKLSTMTIQEKVDVAARLRGPAKLAEKIDKSIKEDIKEKRKGQAGAVLGEVFKAVLAYVPTTRLDQEALKLGDVKVYNKYLDTTDQPRITFEPR